jgi:hypothetical protein
VSRCAYFSLSSETVTAATFGGARASDALAGTRLNIVAVVVAGICDWPFTTPIEHNNGSDAAA